MPLPCVYCNTNNAIIKRPKNGNAACKSCFFEQFENEIHETIITGNLFKKREKVAIAASGGKDSTVLAHVLNLLNTKYQYDLDLCLLSIDEGIIGYRDDSLKTVQQNSIEYNLPLRILSYKDLYGWTMNEVVTKIGLKNNCTFCGVFRRQALDRGAQVLQVDSLAIGHNADDLAETILMNVLRGDAARLDRCTNIITCGENTISRVKPLKYAYEKEIVMYAYHKKLTYFSTECIYAPNAYRGHVRGLIKDLERVNPMYILNIIHSGENLNLEPTFLKPVQQLCQKCQYISSQPLCKACILLEGLNRGLPKLGIGKMSKVKRVLNCTNSNCDKNNC